MVEPTGEVEDDPNLTNTRFRANPTKAFCSRAPLRVTGEVDERTGQRGRGTLYNALRADSITWVGPPAANPEVAMLHELGPGLVLGAALTFGCGADEEIVFVRGSAEDEAAIRDIIDEGEASHYTDDVDWENAFGGRFLGREAVSRFVTDTVEPTLTAAEGNQRVTVRFLGPNLAIADAYWWMVGQAGPHPERVGRNTYVLARSGIGWRIHVVRVADFQQDPIPTRAVDADDPWPVAALSSVELSLYEGLYEQASSGRMPVPHRIWVEGDILRSETKTFGVIDLVPMGEHVFVAGRYVDGELAEIYWPDERQIFQIEDGRAVGYKVLEDTTELSSAIRIRSE